MSNPTNAGGWPRLPAPGLSDLATADNESNVVRVEDSMSDMPAPRKHKRNHVLPYQVHSYIDLIPYTFLPKIYGERKWQKPMKKPQTLTFFDLPAEVRIMVYKHLLIADMPIEIWAETGDQRNDHKVRRKNGSEYRKLFKKRHNLRMLRTCKLVNLEAAEIFYGENQFRFSGLNGHMVAYGWMSKVGPRNWRFIASITVAIPFWSADRDIYGNNWNPSNRRRVNELYDKMPFALPCSTHGFTAARLDYDVSWRVLAKKLTYLPRLQSLTLVLPEDCSYGFPKGDQVIMRGFKKLVAAKPFLEFHVIRMFQSESEASALYKDHAFMIRMLKSLAICRIKLATYDAGGRWYLPRVQPFVDKRGAFVWRKELDTSEEMIDILPDLAQLFE